MGEYMTTRIAITGTTGFVGNRLLASLQETNDIVIEIGRTAVSPDTDFFRIGGITADTDFKDALNNCDVVIHLAARAHVMHEGVANPLEAFLAVNWHGTVNLARQAVLAGVKRFVYVSSIKVNGEYTIDAPFTESDSPAPQDPYAISKWRAEQSLREIGAHSSMEVVVLRPPLVYGPKVKANFYRLMRLVELGWPLPFGRISNQRSMVYVDNLTDALVKCAKHPIAAGKTYLLSDGEDVATPELIRRLSDIMERPARLIPISPYWLSKLSSIIGQRHEIDRLTQSLVIDGTRIQRELDWQPPYTLHQGLVETVQGYLQLRNRKVALY